MASGKVSAWLVFYAACAPGMGGGVSCNETWGGLAGGKVSNVVRKEEERSDGVNMSDAG